jgi:hypothetical protein
MVTVIGRVKVGMPDRLPLKVRHTAGIHSTGGVHRLS